MRLLAWNRFIARPAAIVIVSHTQFLPNMGHSFTQKAFMLAEESQLLSKSVN